MSSSVTTRAYRFGSYTRYKLCDSFSDEINCTVSPRRAFTGSAILCSTDDLVPPALLVGARSERFFETGQADPSGNRVCNMTIPLLDRKLVGLGLHTFPLVNQLYPQFSGIDGLQILVGEGDTVPSEKEHLDYM